MHRFVGYHLIQGNAVIVCLYIRLLKLTLHWACEFVCLRSNGDELSILLGYDATSVSVWFEIFQYSVVVSKRELNTQCHIPKEWILLWWLFCKFSI